MSSAQICAIHLLFSLFVNKDNPCKNDSEERHRLWLANDPGSLYNPGFYQSKIENKYFSHVWGIIESDLGKDVGKLLKEDNLQSNFMPYPLILKFLAHLKSTKLWMEP